MTARCACGRASITVDASPVMHGVCHCANCKQRTGSAFGISAYFETAAVVAREGETRVYAFRHPTQDHEQARHFCAVCGTTLFWHVSTLPDRIGIAGGCFPDGALPEPTYSVCDGQRKPWLRLPSTWAVWAD